MKLKDVVNDTAERLHYMMKKENYTVNLDKKGVDVKNCALQNTPSSGVRKTTKLGISLSYWSFSTSQLEFFLNLTGIKLN